MDQIVIGKFIALLRREQNLTQEQLGEKLGVTNKTVSRWENGNYMPDIEMLQLLAEQFGVSINELLSGQRLTNEQFRREADKNIIAAAKEGAFSTEERKTYFKRKWRREHLWLFIVLLVILAAAAILPFVLKKPALFSLVPLIALAEYGYQNNKMMIYIERNLFDR